MACVCSRSSVFFSLLCTILLSSPLLAFEKQPKLLTTLGGHHKIITGLTYVHKDQYVVSCSEDRTIKVWNVQSGLLVRSLTAHGDGILVCQISPDGTRMLSGSRNGELKVWKTETWEPLYALPDAYVNPSGKSQSAQFSPDGHTIAVTTADKVTLVDTESSKTRHILVGHSGQVKVLQFSKDGQFLLTGGQDGKVLLWNVNSGSLAHEFKTHPNAITSVQFSEDSNLILTASFDGTINLWNKTLGTQLSQFQLPNHATNSLTNDVEALFVPNTTQFLVYRNSGPITFFDWITNRAEKTNDTGFVGLVRLSPAGDLLVRRGVYEENAEVFDLETQRTQKIYPTKGRPRISAFSSDGTSLAIGNDLGYGSPDFSSLEPFTYDRWRSNAQSYENIMRGRFLPENRILTVASDIHRRNNAQIWDLKTGQVVTLTYPWCSYASYKPALTTSDDGKFAIITGADGNLDLWQIDETPQIIKSYPMISSSPRCPCGYAQFSPDSSKVFLMPLSDGHTGYLVDIQTRDQTEFNTSDAISNLMFSPDSTKLAILTRDQKLEVLDVQHPDQKIALPSTPSTVDLIFSQDSSQLLVVSSVKPNVFVTFWDVTSQKKIKTSSWRQKELQLSAFTPDRRKLITTVGYNHEAKVFDVDSGNALFSLVKHKSAIYGIDISPDGSLAITTSADEAYLWNLKTGGWIASLNDGQGVSESLFSQDGIQILVNGQGSSFLWTD